MWDWEDPRRTDQSERSSSSHLWIHLQKQNIYQDAGLLQAESQSSHQQTVGGVAFKMFCDDFIVLEDGSSS